MVYDFKILYIPTVDQLENFMYNDTFIADIDLKHSILKKMDIIVESHKKQNQQLLKVGIGQVDIKLTNKEI